MYRKSIGTLLMQRRKCEGTPKGNGRKSLIDNFPDTFFYYNSTREHVKPQSENSDSSIGTVDKK